MIFCLLYGRAIFQFYRYALSNQLRTGWDKAGVGNVLLCPSFQLKFLGSANWRWQVGEAVREKLVILSSRDGFKWRIMNDITARLCEGCMLKLIFINSFASWVQVCLCLLSKAEVRCNILRNKRWTLFTFETTLTHWDPNLGCFCIMMHMHKASGLVPCMHIPAPRVVCVCRLYFTCTRRSLVQKYLFLPASLDKYFRIYYNIIYVHRL